MIKTVAAMLLACALSFSQSRADQDSSRGDVPPCPGTEAPLPQDMIRPRYPPEALRNGIAAKIELRVVVTAAGKTKDVSVLDGDSEFSRSAVVAIRKWRFRPVSSHGQVVETTYKIHVRFDPLLREANSDVAVESPQPDPLPESLFAKARTGDFGDDVHRVSEEGVVAPKTIYSIEPEFSEKARQTGEQGTVTVSVIVGPTVCRETRSWSAVQRQI